MFEEIGMKEMKTPRDIHHFHVFFFLPRIEKREWKQKEKKRMQAFTQDKQDKIVLGVLPCWKGDRLKSLPSQELQTRFFEEERKRE